MFTLTKPGVLPAWILAVSTSLTTFGSAFADDFPAKAESGNVESLDTTAIDAQVAQELEAGMFLGAVVCAGRPGEIVLLKAYGDKAVGEPMRTDSLFDIASVTKVTTVGTALAITLDRFPKISLDDPITDHLPEVGGRHAETMTIRHLAQHRAGLDNTKRLARDFEGEDLVRAILNHDASWPPENRYVYSCLGMIRLSEMIAQINDREFGAFCREEIFEPLGMNDTQFGPIPQESRSRCVRMIQAPGLISDQNAHKIGRPVGNAGLFSTAEDLAKLATLWLQLGEFEGKPLFSQEIAQTFIREGIVWKRGSGGVIPEAFSPTTFSHTGHTGQTLIVDPDRNLYVMVLTNWRNPAIEAEYEATRLARKRIAQAILDQLTH
jgi:CubicO group peptidase (beta-lactamase class C family)